MSIGLCCQYLEPVTKRNGTIEYKNSTNEKNLQYKRYQDGKYSDQEIQSVWINNSENLLRIIKKIHSEGFRSFRVSSNLFPLYDVTWEKLISNLRVKSILLEIGLFALNNKIRLTTHPDQFVVISSNNPDVINKSVKMLEYHAWVFDCMNLPMTPYYGINIHGGTKGNSTILVESINNLKDNVKSRLTLENDESSYNVAELIMVSGQTGVPIVFDSHHHNFNDAGIKSEHAFDMCCSTWADIKPMTHLSNTELGLEKSSFVDRRKHSDYVNNIPKYQFEANNSDHIDIEFEFKMKNLAIQKAVKDFGVKL